MESRRVPFPSVRTRSHVLSVCVIIKSKAVIRYIPGYLQELKDGHAEELGLFKRQLKEVHLQMASNLLFTFSFPPAEPVLLGARRTNPRLVWKISTGKTKRIRTFRRRNGVSSREHVWCWVRYHLVGDQHRGARRSVLSRCSSEGARRAGCCRGS